MRYDDKRKRFALRQQKRLREKRNRKDGMGNMDTFNLGDMRQRRYNSARKTLVESEDETLD